MGKINKKLLGIAVAGMLTASPAWAVVTLGNGGAALQEVLDDITVYTSACTNTTTPVPGVTPEGSPTAEVSGGGCDSSINVNTDQVIPDSYWELTATGGSIATLIIEMAAFANGNSFGVYDAADSTNRVEIFAGGASASDMATLSILLDGTVKLDNTPTGSVFAGNKFGYYLDSRGQTLSNHAFGGLFFSDPNLNAGGIDNMVAYQGVGDRTQLPGYFPGNWTANEYVLAWEDLDSNAGWSDRDFTDFVVMVESVIPVPAPATLALLGLGLIGMGYRARRNRKSA